MSLKLAKVQDKIVRNANPDLTDLTVLEAKLSLTEIIDEDNLSTGNWWDEA